MAVPAAIGLLAAASILAAADTPGASGTGKGSPVIDAAHPGPVPAWPPESARSGLLTRFRRASRLTVLVFAEPGSTPALYEDLIRHGVGGRLASSIRFVGPDAAPGDLEGPLWVVGPAGTPAAAYLATTPYASAGAPAAGEALRVSSVNPWDPASPLLLAIAGDGGTLRAFLASGAGLRSWDYELVRDGMRMRYGRFLAEGGPWRIDASADVDLRGSFVRLEEGATELLFVSGETPEAEARRTARRLREDLDSFVAKLDGGGGRPRTRIYVHRDLETKALRTGEPRPSHLAGGTEGRPLALHVIALPGGASTPGPDGRLAAADAALRVVFGDSLPAPLEGGAAVLLAGGILGRGLAWWERRLAGSGLAAPAELLAREAPGEGPCFLVRLPAVALLLAEAGAGRDGSRLGAILREPDLERRLSAARPDPVSRRAAPVRPAATAPRTFQKGMGLAHEGYAVMDGYGSRSAVEQMRRLRRLGVEWVAVSPYAFMADPHAAAIRFQRTREQPAGAENDQAVLTTIEEAHRLGLKVLLKPQIWLPPEHWTGDVGMRSEAEWKSFFSEYRRFLAHYALLAAAGEADLLSIGVELGGTTDRTEDWRELITLARRLYDGPLTYSANWGREFESIAFWDALDYAGLDCYYPLLEALDPSDEDLARAASKVADRVEQVHRRSGRPILLTEVGFPALAGAWTSPHDDRADRALDPAAQDRGYRALLSAFWDRPWLAGLYWWKWPTTPEGARPDPAFSPRGRPAERTLAEWYARARPVLPNWPSGLP